MTFRKKKFLALIAILTIGFFTLVSLAGPSKARKPEVPPASPQIISVCKDILPLHGNVIRKSAEAFLQNLEKHEDAKDLEEDIKNGEEVPQEALTPQEFQESVEFVDEGTKAPDYDLTGRAGISSEKVEAAREQFDRVRSADNELNARDDVVIFTHEKRVHEPLLTEEEFREHIEGTAFAVPEGYRFESKGEMMRKSFSSRDGEVTSGEAECEGQVFHYRRFIDGYLIVNDRVTYHLRNRKVTRFSKMRHSIEQVGEVPILDARVLPEYDDRVSAELCYLVYENEVIPVWEVRSHPPHPVKHFEARTGKDIHDFLSLAGRPTEEDFTEGDTEKYKYTYPAGMDREDFTEGDEEDFYYSVDDNEVTITNYKGDIKYLKIPGKIEGKVVTTILYSAFYQRRNLKSVIIPVGVTEIGGGAFARCKSLKSVTIPNGVTEIRMSTFRRCASLESVTIPDSVTKIGEAAFRECESLKSVTIPDSVIEIEREAFAVCKSLESVTIPVGVTEIAMGTFAGCESLESVTIPDGVTEVGGFAFRRCTSLESVTIPDSVTKIGESAFRECESLESIIIPDSVTKIERGAFAGCKSLRSFTIPEGVTEIGEEAFKDCKSLESINIPDSVSKIGVGAFRGCETLKSVTIPEKVTKIEEATFRGCRNLELVNIPDSVNEIGRRAFLGCESLKSVTIPDSVTEIGWFAFNGCVSLESVIFTGDAPEDFSNRVFDDTHDDFKIYYYEDASGFSSPKWKGYPTEEKKR